MADDALREFEVSHGMATPETTKDAAIGQGIGAGHQDAGTASRRSEPPCDETKRPILLREAERGDRSAGR